MADFDSQHSPDTDVVAKDDRPSELFTVSVKGTGVELTRTVDQATALHVISIVLGGAGVAPQAVPQAPAANPNPTQRDVGSGSHPETDDNFDPSTTVGEYIDACGARQNPAKITAIGRYLQLKLGQDTFTRDEVKSQFRPAGETPPGNYSRDFADAIAQRWIAEDPHAKGQYYVANTGIAAIAAKFDKSTRRATPARRKRTAAKSDNGDTTSDDTTEAQDLDAG
ncbi:hypothetical protein [Mycobacterium sp. M23085]|uniref:hypothetical protein n=1 Tax=Mycobacterium sp. M23085 TaxID=3378087 RepID=UPI003877BA25